MTQDFTPWQKPQDRILIYYWNGFWKPGKRRSIYAKTTVADHGGKKKYQKAQKVGLLKEIYYVRRKQRASANYISQEGPEYILFYLHR